MDPSMMTSLKELEEETRRLKKMYAEAPFKAPLGYLRGNIDICILSEDRTK